MWHLSINVFEKKAPLELVFITCCPVYWGAEGLRVLTEDRWDSSQGCSLHRGAGQGRWEGQVPWQCWSSDKSMVTGQVCDSPRKSSQQVRATRHRAGCRHASEMAPAKTRTGERVWGRATCSKAPKGRTTNAKKDATFNNSGHCFKWTGACISNGISSNLLLSAFIIQFSVSERYKTERYRTDWFYGQAFYR